MGDARVMWRVVRALGVGLVATIVTAWVIAVAIPMQKGYAGSRLADSLSAEVSDLVNTHENYRFGSVRRAVVEVPAWFRTEQRAARELSVAFQRGGLILGNIRITNESFPSSLLAPRVGSPRAWGQLDRVLEAVKQQQSELNFTGPATPGWNQFSTPLSSWEPASAASEARGFPTLALWCALDSDSTAWERFAKDGAIPLPGRVAGRSGADWALPYRPIWSGLLTNTLFYAACWFGLTSSVNSLRRYRRFKRGRCPRCFYDLAFDYRNGCPECAWRRGPKKGGDP
ncbi:MAG: hypothetical protein AAGI17_00975 [Planctomycetota bacterium]